MIAQRRLTKLYNEMVSEVKGPATLNYILALSSKVDELQMRVDALRLELDRRMAT